jgi:hypothetical protein
MREGRHWWAPYQQNDTLKQQGDHESRPSKIDIS